MKVNTLLLYITVNSRKFFANKIVYNFLLPGVLLLFALGFSSFSALTYTASYTVLPHAHTDSYSITPREGDLYAGRFIRGEFQAKENHLGAVAIRMHNYNKEDIDIRGRGIGDDEIIFRFREKGKSKWYYEQHYSGGQFLELVHFPFGFVPISDSKGKNYQFEITSLRGRKGNALKLTNKEPIIITNYQFNKTELINNRTLLLSFILQKNTYAFARLEFYFIVFIFLLPFIFYILYRSFLKRFLSAPLIYVFTKVNKAIFETRIRHKMVTIIGEVSVFTLFLVLGLVVDIIFIEHTNGLITMTLFSLWLFIALFRRLDSKYTYSLSIGFLALCVFLFALGQSFMAEKSAIWALLLILLGTLQGLIEVNIAKK